MSGLSLTFINDIDNTPAGFVTNNGATEGSIEIYATTQTNIQIFV